MVACTALLAMLFALLLNINGAMSCPSMCSCRWNSYVDCDYKSLTVIPSGIPAETITLDLDHNSITSLPTEAFSPLTRLKNLYLNSNAISVISSGAFSNLNNLEKLRLNHNDISTLSPNIFSSLSQLKSLYLNINAISAISYEVFNGVTSLEILDLANNNITTLQANVFSFLSRLKSFYLSSNRISVISSRAFHGLTSLDTLHLQDNSIDTLPTNVFNGLHNLRYLYLHQNKIPSLPVDIFRELDELKYLLLDNNNLTTFPLGVFDNLNNLESLRLTNNRIASLASATLLSLNSLKTLELQNNLLTRVVGVNGLPSLTTLKLYGNCLTSLQDGDFENLRKLRSLYLQNTCIAKLSPSLFRGLRNLRYLYLNNNNLTELPIALFDDTTNLTNLYMQKNALATLPSHLFSGLSLLRELDLSYNKLRQLPIMLSLNNLQSLSLSHNLIDSIPDNIFGSLFEIWKLDFSFNKLRMIPKFTFASDDYSIEITFRGNPITEIGPDAFNWLSGKTYWHLYLDLSEMTLSYISESAFEGFNTVHDILINLEKNQLTFLQKSSISTMLLSESSQYISLSLHDNPWACDCRLSALRRWLETVHSITYGYVDLSGLTCKTPHTYAGLDFMHIADENMTCSTPEFSELVRWIDVEEGDAIELSCNATGVPEPDVYWITSSGDIVNSNKNINTTVVDDFELNSHGTLVITSTLMKHSGTYVCIAVNLKGKAACATHLRIIPKVTSSTVYNEMAIVANATIPISNLKSISEHESHVGIATGAFFGGLVLGVGVIIIILIAAVKRKRNSKEDARPEQKSKITIRFSDLKAVFKNRQYTEDSNGNSVSDTNITDTKNEGAAAALRDTRDRYVKPQEISDQLSRTQIYANVNVVETGDSTYASLSPDTRAPEHVYETFTK